MSNTKNHNQNHYQKHDPEQLSKLVTNAVLEGWTVRLHENGNLEMTKPKNKLKQEVSFNGGRYVSKLLK